MKTWKEIQNTPVDQLEIGQKFLMDDDQVAEITDIDRAVPSVEWVSVGDWDESGNLYLHSNPAE